MLFPLSCAGCGAAGPGPCPRCWESLTSRPVRRRAGGLDSLTACCPYDGVGAELVAGLKFRGNHRLAAPLGTALAALVDARVDVVTWIPATAAHRRRRGYDQGRLLARAVAADLEIGFGRLLRRGGRRSQLGATRAERLAGPSLSARAAVPEHVLVVDDVVTTGASFGAAAAALRRSGARHVHGVAVAATRP